MNSTTGLLLVIVLYTLFSFVLYSAFHTVIMFFFAGIVAAIAGFLISLVVERR